MNTSILGLSGDQFTAEDEEFMPISTLLLANRRNGVRRPLQYLVLGDLLPLCSQRARPGSRLCSHDRMVLLADQRCGGCGRRGRRTRCVLYRTELSSKCCEQQVRKEGGRRASKTKTKLVVGLKYHAYCMYFKCTHTKVCTQLKSQATLRH